MTDLKEQASQIASTLPREHLPTMTWRPPVSFLGSTDKSRSQSDATRGSHLPFLNLISEAQSSSKPCDFEIGDLIGSGGLGTVHVADQSCLHRDVAVKRVRGDRRTEAAEEQLKREGYLMGQLEHPSIPPVYLVGLGEEDRTVLVMRRIQGIPWDDKIAEHGVVKDGSLLQGSALRAELNTFARICEAIAFAHEKGILHRDVKPSNVVVGWYGEVYLLDWGIAVELEDDGFYEAKGFAGTPSFAAPEMLGRRPNLDCKTDVYLLGATLYSVVTGTPPHAGTSTEDVFESVLTSPLPTFSDDWSEPLALLCRKAMEPDPQDRYISVRALLEDLRYVLDYGELAALEAACDRDLSLLMSLANQKEVDFNQFDEIGTRCRFGLERILNDWPGNISVETKLKKCLHILCNAAISRHRIASARVMLQQYRAIRGDSQADRLDRLQQRIDALADQMIARQDDSSIKAQARLVERIANQQREIETLRSQLGE